MPLQVAWVALRRPKDHEQRRRQTRMGVAGSVYWPRERLYPLPRLGMAAGRRLRWRHQGSSHLLRSPCWRASATALAPCM